MVPGRRLYHILLAVLTVSYNPNVVDSNSKMKSILPIVMLSMLTVPRRVVPLPVPVPYPPPVITKFVPFPVWPSFHGGAHGFGNGFGHGILDHSHGLELAGGHKHLGAEKVLLKEPLIHSGASGHEHLGVTKLLLKEPILIEEPTSHSHRVKTVLVQKRVREVPEIILPHKEEYEAIIPDKEGEYQTILSDDDMDHHFSGSYRKHAVVKVIPVEQLREYKLMNEKDQYVSVTNERVADLPVAYKTKHDFRLPAPFRYKGQNYNRVWQPPEPQEDFTFEPLEPSPKYRAAPSTVWQEHPPQRDYKIQQHKVVDGYRLKELPKVVEGYALQQQPKVVEESRLGKQPNMVEGYQLQRYPEVVEEYILQQQPKVVAEHRVQQQPKIMEGYQVKQRPKVIGGYSLRQEVKKVGRHRVEQRPNVVTEYQLQQHPKVIEGYDLQQQSKRVELYELPQTDPRRQESMAIHRKRN